MSMDSQVMELADVSRRRRRWLLPTAVSLIVLGLISIVEPGIAGVAFTVLLGWLLVVGGITHAIDAFSEPAAFRVLLRIAIALVYGAAGAYLLLRPVLGLGALTLLLAIVFAVEAGLRLYLYMRMRREAGAGWMLMNAAVTMLLAGSIWARWPASSIWAIGTLVGINLLFAGCVRLSAAFATGRPVDSVAA